MRVGAGVVLSLGLLAAPARAEFVDHSDVFEPVFGEGPPAADGPGVGFVDHDGDGDDDILVSHGPDGVRLYENLGPPDFAFEDVTDETGLGAVDFGFAFGLAATDLDRDGDPDLVVADRDRGVRVLENRDAAFVDVSVLAGLLEPLTSTSLAVADLDGDGWTDVWAAGGRDYYDAQINECASGVVLHAQGDFTFDEVASAWGVVDPGCTLAVLASDFDRDGDADLLSANDFGQVSGPNRLFRNDGLRADGSVAFTDVSESSGFARRMFGMGLASADVDGDSWPDYYVTNIGRAILLFGSEDGVFEEAAARWGVDAELARDGLRVTWGAAFLDVEMDGALDLFVVNGQIPTGAASRSDPNARSMLFGGLDGAHRPVDAAAELGLDPVGSFKGAAVADFDRDGDDDVLTAALGGPVHLFRNDAEPAAVVSVALQGTVSNPEALGAWIELRCAGIVRSREVVSTGSYASTHSPIQRIPLAGCADGATLEIRWPSGLAQTVDVPADGAVLSLVEPEWITVEPAWLPADGASTATIRVTPIAPDGSLVGPGRDVAATATAGTISPVSDLGDGTYETSLVAPLSAGSAALSFEIDGEPVAAHPRVRFFDGDRTLVRAARASAAPGAEVAIAVVPRDAAGALDGPGLDVTLDVVGGTAVAPAEDQGDGRYLGVVVADGGAPVVASARVGGIARGEAVVLSPIEALDPSETLVRITPGAMSSADAAESSVEVLVSARDGRGVPVGAADAHAYELVGTDGPVDPIGIGFGPSFSAGWRAQVAAADVVRAAPIGVRVDGVPLSRALDLPAVEDVEDVLALVDPRRSGVGVSPEIVRADGEDYAHVVALLADADGDPLPWPAECILAGDAFTIDPPPAPSGTQYPARVRSVGPLGRQRISIRCGETDLDVGAPVYVVEPIEHDLATLDVETCPLPPVIRADGAASGRLAVRPRDERGNLVGSNVPLRVRIDDVEVALDYAEPGTYFVAIGATDVPGETWIETELVGTGRKSRTYVERLAPGVDPEDRERTGCVTLEPAPVVAEDAGPDAGGDAGPTPSPEDASPPEDEAGMSHDASPVGARGAGCSCGSAGTGGGFGWPCALVSLLWPLRQGRHIRRSRPGSK